MFRGMVGIVLALGCVIMAQSPPSFRVQTLAGSSFAGDGRPATQALLRQAEGVAVAADGTVYIADAADHRVRAVGPDGLIRTVAGDGAPGFSGDDGPAQRARLNNPYGLSLDRNGTLYIADLGNGRVRAVSPDGKIRTVAGGGQIPAGEGAEGSAATSLRLRTPRNVLADNAGGFYFSDFDAHRVYAVDFRGILSVLAGTGNPGYGADNIAANRSALRNPAGLAFEPLGGIVIAESGAQRLRRVARGIIGAYMADALRQFPLFAPTGVALDAAGNLYIADSRATGALRRTPQGEIVALATGGRGVAADPRGGAYYANGTGVFRVDAANRVTLAAGGAGASELSGDGISAAEARLQSPAGIVFDREGNLYFTDEAAHRVRRISVSGVVTTLAGTGRAGYSGDGGPATRATLNAPRGLALDRSGNLYIADSGNHTVRMIAAANGVITTVSGNGFRGNRGDGGPAISAQFDTPSAVAIDPAGLLYIADTGNHRVRRIGSAGLIATYAGTGTKGSGFDGSSAVMTPLDGPMGLAFDVAGNLYIADTGNNRVRRVDPTGLLTTIGNADLTSPRGITVAPEGSVYVADTGRHRICLVSGVEILPVAGSATGGFSGDGGPALEAEFQFPAALAFDANGNIAVADLGNGRIRRLTPEAVLVSSILGNVKAYHAASGLETALAPGMLLTLRGDNIGPAEPAQSGEYPTSLGGVEVRVNGIAAALLYVSARQVNLVAPTGIAGSREAVIEVTVDGRLVASATALVAEAVPGLFSAIVHEDGSLNGIANPAVRGSEITLYATGEGLAPLSLAEVQVGTSAAPVIGIGPVAGSPGLLRITVRVPSGFFPAGSYTVRLRIGSVAAREPVVLYVQ